MRGMLLGWLLLVGLACAQAGVGVGLVSLGPDKLELKSAMAVWKPSANSLTLSWFPFALAPEQLQALERFPADYTVADYPEKKPFVRLNLDFKPESRGAYQARDVKSATLSAWRIGEGTSMTIQGAPKQLKLEGDFRRGGELSVELKWQHRSAFGKKLLYAWNVSARCRAYTEKPVP